MTRLGNIGALLCLLLFLCLQNTVHGLAVMSVDLGSEWMKVAIVSPGVPMEIALNKESKRKTPVAVSFRNGERMFGEDALTVGVRFPKSTYFHFMDLLGKKVDNPVVKLFQKQFPFYDIVPDPVRGTVVFQHDSETQHTPEELLSMVLSYAREMAQEFAGQPINEAVLTVPSYFNQAERKAVLRAAELASIKVLQLMNDHLAVALNYGIFRQKDFNESAQYMMFYDMGSHSTKAVVASYQLVRTKEKGYVETNPQITVLGVGYDRTLGGLEFQLRLRDFLASKFNDMKKTPNDVFKNPRAMAKLLKEAGRLKNVLSANADHYAQVEGILDDHDFRVQVKREDMEALCGDLFDRVKWPIEMALKASGLAMDSISQVILVGAGTRVPKVQEKLFELVNMELGKSMNTDESAAMGAVYKAADLSTGFKVKKIVTKDSVIFPIQVNFEREVEGEDGVKILKIVRRTLFGLTNPYPQKKVLTFNKHTNDFSFYVNYGELDHLPAHEIEGLGSLNITKVDLFGVAEALNKNAGKNVDVKGVKAHFAMDDSGVLNLTHVESVFERTLSKEEEAAEGQESPLSKLGSTISRFFSGSEETPPATAAEEEESKSAESDKAEKKEEKENKTKEEEEKKEELPKEEDGSKNDTKKEEKKPKVVTVKEPIDFEERRLDIIDLDGAKFIDSQKKIETLNDFDRKKMQREKAMNALESFVLEIHEKLDTAEYQKATTEAEADRIRAACSEVSDWLYEDGADADTSVYEKRLKELKALAQSLLQRVKEHRDRPEALAALHEMLNISSNFLNSARNLPADEQRFTAVELDTLEKLVTEAAEWRDRMVKQQADVPLSDAPKLTVKAIAEKISALDREVKYLVNKARLSKPKKATDSKETNKNETDSKSDETKTEDEQIEEAKFESQKRSDGKDSVEVEEEKEDSILPPDTDSSNNEEEDAQSPPSKPSEEHHTEL